MTLNSLQNSLEELQNKHPEYVSLVKRYRVYFNAV